MTNEVAVCSASALSAVLSAQAAQNREFLNQVLAWLTEKGLAFALSLVAAVVILLLGALAVKAIVALVGKAVEKGGRGNSLFANFIRNATSKICWTILIVIALGKLGVDIAPIVAGLGVTGFILGFAFQESLGNLASGLMIALNEPFKLGDYVIVAGHEGTVLKVDMMATVLATPDNKKIVIPNKSTWGSPIVNFSALRSRRVDIRIGIDYGTDLAKALDVARTTLQTVPNILAEPAPAVTVATLADSSIVLNVRPWADSANYWAVYHDTQVALVNAFAKAGLTIPFPQLTVHLDK